MLNPHKTSLQNLCAAPPPHLWFQRPPNSLQVMDREALAHQVADRIVDTLRQALRRSSNATFVPSAGRTLLRTYQLLRDSYRDELDWSRVVCVQMDEYAGLGSGDPRSFAFQLTQELVGPLGIGRFVHFFSTAGVASVPLDLYERQLRLTGGIDCAVHGVGRNGHIAFNEPETPTPLRTRLVQLAEATRAANGIPFRQGVTLGLSVLGEARSSIVVLLGPEKRKAAQALLYDPPGPQNPAAHLQSSSNGSIYMDDEALPLAPLAMFG